MLTYTDSNLSVTLDRLGADEDDSERGRVGWSLTFRHLPTGTVLLRDTGLRTTQETTEVGALRSCASFLGAYCEAQRYPGSENADLFGDLFSRCEDLGLDLESFADLLSLETDEGED